MGVGGWVGESVSVCVNAKIAISCQLSPQKTGEGKGLCLAGMLVIDKLDHQASASYATEAAQLKSVYSHLTTAIPFLSCIKRVTDNNMMSLLLETVHVTIFSYPDPSPESQAVWV